MSTSDLYLVFKSSARHFSEHRNGHGSGPAIWGTLRKMHGLRDGWGREQEAEDRKLWALARNPEVPPHLRLAHAFTFDRAYCPTEHLMKMADALEAAHADILRIGPFTWSHFADFAQELRRAARKPDRRLRGVALNCTSVSDAWIGGRIAKDFDPLDCFAYATDLDPCDP